MTNDPEAPNADHGDPAQPDAPPPVNPVSEDEAPQALTPAYRVKMCKPGSKAEQREMRRFVQQIMEVVDKVHTRDVMKDFLVAREEFEARHRAKHRKEKKGDSLTLAGAGVSTLSFSTGDVIYRPPGNQGQFVAGPNGTMIWEEPGGPPQPAISAPGWALYYLANFAIAGAMAATEACGWDVASAVGLIAFAGFTGSYVAVFDSIEFLINCAMKGSDGAPEY